MGAGNASVERLAKSKRNPASAAHFRTGMLKAVAIALVFLAPAGALAAAQFTHGASAETARFLVQDLAAGRFDAVEARFDGQMRAAFPKGRLAATWNSLERQVGKFQKVRGVVVSGRGLSTFTLVCQFERSDLDAVITFSRYGRIAGLFFRPSAADAWTAPAYAATKNFREIPVIVKTGRWSLPGTLALPRGRGPFPAVVLVHGSGPGNEDEVLGTNKPFKDLAWGLASRSIAVLRYENRTARYGAASSTHWSTFTVNDEIVEDSRSAVALLAKRPEIDSRRIFVLGYGWGARLAPRIATGDQTVSGLVLLAGAITPVERLALDRARRFAAREHLPPQSARRQIAEVESEVKQIESPHLKPGTMVEFLGVQTPSSYWLDLRGYHPGQAAATLAIPMLILQGGRDELVPPGQLGLWEKALAGHKNVTFKLFPTLNHLFENGFGPSVPGEYLLPGHVDRKVISTIASWVKGAKPGN